MIKRPEKVRMGLFAVVLIMLSVSSCSTLPNDTLGLTVDEWRNRTYGEQLVLKREDLEVWTDSGRDYRFVNKRLTQIEQHKMTPEEIEARQLKLERYRLIQQERQSYQDRQERIMREVIRSQQQQPSQPPTVIRPQTGTNCISTTMGDQIYTRCD